MPQVIHPILGISRPDGEYPHVCSKCTTELSDDACPLMMWDNTGHVMWVICEACEGAVVDAIRRSGTFMIGARRVDDE
jgi:hypothetical protein